MAPQTRTWGNATRTPTGLPPSWRDVRRPRRVVGSGRGAARKGLLRRAPPRHPVGVPSPGGMARHLPHQGAPGAAPGQVRREYEQGKRAFESAMVSAMFLITLLLIIAGFQKSGRRRRRRPR